MQQNLLEQQMSAISHLEHNFPLMPPELLEVISVVINTLLVPVIFPVLLHHMANDNLEIFAYLLKRPNIFKGFPFSDQSARDEEILDCTRWNAAICLRLIDQNWQMCFVDRAGKITASNETTNSTSNPSSSTFSSPDRWKASSTTPSTPATTGSSLSSSRWAKAGTSSPSSNFTSSRRNYSPSSHSTASTNALFHPSKIAALAKSFTPSDEDVLRWSAARWRLVLEDLELFLCRTSILADVPDGKQKAELLLKAARKNVDAWKAA